ncbi:MAG: Asp23/Gls24 family envelope stress response protein [Lachnospiraceae bacterium]|nr:Asp23/Gls24 family envelope stress response protein [Lachnospiraceae bacterium]MCR4936889.1 Asp23/Gls24 family envelope stress response protein [Lachnospiraceae bacterium]
MESDSIKLNLADGGKGTVCIADDVVAVIASLAASEVEGVSSPVGSITNELMSKTGMSKLTKGTKVSIMDNTVSVNLSLVLEASKRIPETCKQVQEKVKNAIENMTGLSVANVNIKISSVDLSGV